MKNLIVTFLALCLAVAGCSRPAPVETEIAADITAWQPVAPLDMTDTQKAQQELVLSATNALAAEMMGELVAALDSGGPDAAIGVCRTTAPTVAAHRGRAVRPSRSAAPPTGSAIQPTRRPSGPSSTSPS